MGVVLVENPSVIAFPLGRDAVFGAFWTKMEVMKLSGIQRLCCGLVFAAVFSTAVDSSAATRLSSPCKKLTLQGEVTAGHEWSADLGSGWVFRVIPIQPTQIYSGWDLVIDRHPGTGFPDALLLATPPYNSINEREVGNTFGLRAQDAIGWNPRIFRFLVSPSAFHEAQHVYRAMTRDGAFRRKAPTPDDVAHFKRLLELQAQSSPGELRILDARLRPGIADPAPFAQRWAATFARTKHQIDGTPGPATPLGSLEWMQFSVSLWLPQSWKLPRGVKAEAAACPE